ncbi:phosphorylase family protein [Chitinibacteraceae bacterium HSL-7]
MKLQVLFPTAIEADGFACDGVATQVSGVGVSATAATTTRVILQQQPDVLILAGIAGVYPGSRFAVGDAVIVASEAEADLGFFGRDGFAHLSALDLGMDIRVPERRVCVHAVDTLPLPLAHSNTLNAALAPFAALDGVDIENMEGAAFFHACEVLGQRHYQVRAISNLAVVDHPPWDMAGSIAALHRGLHQLIAHLRTT